MRKKEAMSIYDPTSEQIVYQYATDRMWASDPERQPDGDVESLSGFFGLLEVRDEENAAELIKDWTVTYNGGSPVLDVRPVDLIGYWTAECSNAGNHYVYKWDTAQAMRDAYDVQLATYSAWCDNEEEGLLI